MDDDRETSILSWPFRVVSAFRVHLIVATVIGTVWFAGWARSMQPQWSTEHLNLPPLAIEQPLREKALAHQQAMDAAAAADHAQTDAPNATPAAGAKKLARRPRSYGPMATLRDGVD